MHARNHMSAACRQERVSWARSQRHLTSIQWWKRVFTDEFILKYVRQRYIKERNEHAIG